MKAKYQIIALLVAATLIFALGVANVFSSFRQVEAAASARDQSRAAISSAEHLLFGMTNAEVSQLGYALTGNEKLLSPYLEVRDGIDANLKTLIQLSASRTPPIKLDALVTLTQEKLAEMSAVIEQHRKQDTAGAHRMVIGGEGKHLIESIRTEVLRYIRIENATMAESDVTFESNMHRLFIVIVIASIFVLLFAMAFAWLFFQRTQQRLKNLLHVETRHLLEAQEALNSQLQRANTSTRESEENLAVTLNSIGDAVIATDNRACITRLNPVAEQITGWTQAEAIGRPVKTVFQIINKVSRQPAVIPVMATLARGTIQGLANHTVLIARDGSEVDIADSCAPIRDRDGLVIGAVLIFRNVTEEYMARHALAVQQHELTLQNDELRQSRAALEASQARYFDLYELAPVGYCTLSVHGLIIEANLTATTLLGMSRGGLAGMEMSGFIHCDDLAAYHLALQQLMDSGVTQIFDVRMTRYDKSLLWANLSATTTTRDDGTSVIRIVLSDISARKFAAEALHKAEALQNAIFSSANFSCIATDAKGVIQIFNVGAERMLGYNAADVMNKVTPADISDPQEVVARAEALSAELGTLIEPGFEALAFKASRGIEDIYELTYVRRDQSRLPAIVSVTALRDVENLIIGYLLIGSDNTMRKQAETERARLDQILQDKNTELGIAKFEADKANLAKSEFLSSMSHELRTPLGAILGFAQLLESGTPEPTTTQLRSIDQILKAGWYLLELINEILDLALIESGKLLLSLEPVSLVDVLLECEAMVEPQAKKYGVSVVFAALEMPLFAKADRTRVKQILLNLLSNAIKYNKIDGTVTVECTLSAENLIRVSVRDSGIGLTVEQLAQLFQPFNRLGQRANVEEGTGIGLVVCKRLIELMHGEIGVESIEGQGSVFWIELGRTDAPQADLHREKLEFSSQVKNETGSPRYTVLYVEDNPANLMLIEDILARRPDIRLLSARDGLNGIEIARASQPDIVLMDINLPGISGIQALRILAKDPLTAHIPVVALSANAMPRDIEKGLTAGFFKYLTKPIKVIEFMSTLDMALQRASVDRIMAIKKETE